MEPQHSLWSLPPSVAERAMQKMRQDHMDRFRNLKVGRELAENLEWRRPKTGRGTTLFAKSVDDFLWEACLEKEEPPPADHEPVVQCIEDPPLTTTKEHVPLVNPPKEAPPPPAPLPPPLTPPPALTMPPPSPSPPPPDLPPSPPPEETPKKTSLSPSPAWTGPEEKQPEGDGTVVLVTHQENFSQTEINFRQKELEDVSTWQHLLVGFTQDSSLHGIRYTTGSSQFTSRRWLWSVLMLGSLAVFIFYVQDRMSEYFAYKKTVNVEVDYVPFVSFPSVTICNENPFRLTAAANGGWYNQVERLLNVSQDVAVQPCGPNEFECEENFCIAMSKVCDDFPDCLNGRDEDQNCNSTQTWTVKESALLLSQNANDSTISLRSMYDRGSHSLDEMILGCSWKGVPCNKSHIFQKTYTDLGVCYRFAQEDARVTQSGPGYGLSITVNIEQYDYTKNPETGVGIKVLMNDHWDVPLLGDRAFAISPGLYSLVSIERTNVKNLEPPWGVCGESSLTYYSQYSVPACNLDCENRYIRTQCGCRDVHMPDVGDGIDFCQVGHYIDCARPKLEEMRKAGNFCTCATPCEEQFYVPNLSFSSISVDTDAGGAAQRQRVERLSAKLKEAREIRFRLQRDKYRDTLRMFFDMDQGLETIVTYVRGQASSFSGEKGWLTTVKDLMEGDCLTFTTKQTTILHTLRNTAAEAVRRYTDFILTYLLAPTVSLQRTLTDAATSLGNQSTPEEFDSYNQTVAASLVEILWYVDLASKELLEMLNASISTLPVYGEYSYDSELLTPLLGTSRVNCSWCVPPAGAPREPLVALMVTRLMGGIRGELLVAIDEVKTSAEMLTLTYYNQTYKANITYDCPEPDLTTAGTMTTADMTTDVMTTQVMTTETIPICYNETVIAGWDSPVTMTQYLLNNITSYLSTIESSLGNVVSEGYDMVDELLRHVGPKCESELGKLYDEYNDIYTKLQRTLSDAESHHKSLQREFSSFQTEYVAVNLTLPMVLSYAKFETHKTFISAQSIALDNLLSSRTNALNRVRGQVNSINYWMLAQVDPGYFMNNSRVWEYFGVNKYKASDASCLGTRCLVEPALEAAWWDSRVLSLNGEMTGEQNALLGVIGQAEDYLTTFTAGNIIDDAFYKKNLLQMDLFFKELTKKSVKQQKAYEYPALLSELGGLMGLMLGASVLTIIELVDMIIYNGVIKCIVNYQETKKRRGSAVMKTNGNHVMPL